MFKIRQPRGRLIFNMGIPIHVKDGIWFETGPCMLLSDTEISSYQLTQPLSCWIYFRKCKNIFAFSVISQYWDDIGCWNVSSWKIRTCFSCSLNAFVAYVTAMQGARASAAMVFIKFCWNVLVLAPKGLVTVLVNYDWLTSWVYILFWK